KPPKSSGMTSAPVPSIPPTAGSPQPPAVVATPSPQPTQSARPYSPLAPPPTATHSSPPKPNSPAATQATSPANGKSTSLPPSPPAPTPLGGSSPTQAPQPLLRRLPTRLSLQSTPQANFEPKPGPPAQSTLTSTFPSSNPAHSSATASPNPPTPPRTNTKSPSAETTSSGGWTADWLPKSPPAQVGPMSTPSQPQRSPSLAPPQSPLPQQSNS